MLNDTVKRPSLNLDDIKRLLFSSGSAGSGEGALLTCSKRNVVREREKERMSKKKREGERERKREGGGERVHEIGRASCRERV